MTRPAKIWVAGVGSLVVLDVALDRKRDGSTLSEATRLVFRTDTLLGKVAFVAFWTELSRWFVPHILFPRP